MKKLIYLFTNSLRKTLDNTCSGLSLRRFYIELCSLQGKTISHAWTLLQYRIYSLHTNHIKSHRIKQEEIRGLGQKYGYKLSSDMAKVAGYKIKNEKIDLPIY